MGLNDCCDVPSIGSGLFLFLFLFFSFLVWCSSVVIVMLKPAQQCAKALNSNNTPRKAQKHLRSCHLGSAQKYVRSELRCAMREMRVRACDSCVSACRMFAYSTHLDFFIYNQSDGEGSSGLHGAEQGKKQSFSRSPRTVERRAEWPFVCFLQVTAVH